MVVVSGFSSLDLLLVKSTSKVHVRQILKGCTLYLEIEKIVPSLRYIKFLSPES